MSFSQLLFVSSCFFRTDLMPNGVMNQFNDLACLMLKHLSGTLNLQSVFKRVTNQVNVSAPIVADRSLRPISTNPNRTNHKLNFCTNKLPLL